MVWTTKNDEMHDETSRFSFSRSVDARDEDDARSQFSRTTSHQPSFDTRGCYGQSQTTCSSRESFDGPGPKLTYVCCSGEILSEIIDVSKEKEANEINDPAPGLTSPILPISNGGVDNDVSDDVSHLSKFSQGIASAISSRGAKKAKQRGERDIRRIENDLQKYQSCNDEVYMTSSEDSLSLISTISTSIGIKLREQQDRIARMEMAVEKAEESYFRKEKEISEREVLAKKLLEREAEIEAQVKAINEAAMLNQKKEKELNDKMAKASRLNMHKEKEITERMAALDAAESSLRERSTGSLRMDEARLDVQTKERALGGERKAPEQDIENKTIFGDVARNLYSCFLPVEAGVNAPQDAGIPRTINTTTNGQQRLEARVHHDDKQNSDSSRRHARRSALPEALGDDARHFPRDGHSCVDADRDPGYTMARCSTQRGPTRRNSNSRQKQREATSTFSFKRSGPSATDRNAVSNQGTGRNKSFNKSDRSKRNNLGHFSCRGDLQGTAKKPTSTKPKFIV